jgi:hypothetical protein
LLQEIHAARKREECAGNGIINKVRNEIDGAQQEQTDRYERLLQEIDAARERAECARNGIINEVRYQMIDRGQQKQIDRYDRLLEERK